MLISWRSGLRSRLKKTPLEQTAYEAAWARLLEYLAWRDKPYDGILGVLPEWAPNDTQDRFIETRCRLLADYPHAELLEALQAYATPHPLIRKEIRHDIAYLYRIKQAVALGKEDGLRLLAGEQIALDAVTGGKVRDGGRKGHEGVHGTAEKKELRWNEYRLELEQQHKLDPTLSYVALCKRVAKKFGTHKRTIARHTTDPHKK